MHAITATGRHVDLDRIGVEDIAFPSIAYQLARINRYAGAAQWSVAQHSILVSAIVDEEIKSYALLHDAHEAFIGDINKPAHEALPPMARMQIDDLKWRIQKVVWDAAGLPHPTQETVAALKLADREAADLEIGGLFGASRKWRFEPPVPGPAHAVEKAFLGYLRARLGDRIQPAVQEVTT